MFIYAFEKQNWRDAQEGERARERMGTHSTDRQTDR